MKRSATILITALAGLHIIVLLTASTPREVAPPARVERGRYLVNLAGCGDCHTPLKMGAHGPEPDGARYLSGHPADMRLPAPPALANTPWNAVTAGLTAWSGPWGVSYASNLTPDETTGLGVWTAEMFVKAMRTGQHMGGGRPIMPPMPWRNLAQLPDEDLHAIFAYLQSIKPIKNHVPESVGRDGGWE